MILSTYTTTLQCWIAICLRRKLEWPQSPLTVHPLSSLLSFPSSLLPPLHLATLSDIIIDSFQAFCFNHVAKERLAIIIHLLHVSSSLVNILEALLSSYATPWLVLSRIWCTCHFKLWRLTLDPLWHNSFQNQKVKLKKRISDLFSIGRQFQVQSAVNTTVFNVYSDSELCNVWGLSIIREYRSVPQICPPPPPHTHKPPPVFLVQSPAAVFLSRA